jgi:type IV fimbrial biogenesis protein FimT
MKRREKGLTLIELMVTLAVAIVILAIGIPSFDRMHINNRIVSFTNQIVSALTLARLEAITRGTPTTVCARSAPTAQTCATSANSANWLNGWLVFSDRSGTVGVIDTGGGADDEIIRAFEAPPGKASIAVSETSTASKKSEVVDFVHFLSTGQRLDFSGDYREAGFALGYEGASANQRRCVTVNQSGRIQTNRIADAASCP